MIPSQHMTDSAYGPPSCVLGAAVHSWGCERTMTLISLKVIHMCTFFPNSLQGGCSTAVGVAEAQRHW